MVTIKISPRIFLIDLKLATLDRSRNILTGILREHTSLEGIKFGVSGLSVIFYRIMNVGWYGLDYYTEKT